jgi:hypothetical protein
MSSTAAAPAKLLTVVQLIPAMHAGGAERSALEISRALVQAGHRSVVISAGGRLVPQLLAEGGESDCPYCVEHLVLVDLGRPRQSSRPVRTCLAR